jgi:hypothetical protein
LRWSRRTLALRRTQSLSLSQRWVTSVRLQVAANCRRVPTGRTMLLRLLPRVVRQLVASPDGANVVVAVGANLRFKGNAPLPQQAP